MSNLIMPPPTPINRTSRAALWLNLSVWIGLVLLMNGLIFGLNRNTNTDPTPSSARYDVPGWLIGAAWVLLFGLMATARWRLNRFLNNDNARWWTTVLLINCLLYPLYTSGLNNPYAGLVGNLLTVGISLPAIGQAWSLDRTAAGLLTTVPLWVIFATFSIVGQLGWLDR